MKLFGSYTSPYVRHCRVVLAQTRLECEFVETDYQQSAAQSPTRRVPFLSDGELVLTDSASILRYLRERAGQPFFSDVAEFDRFLLVNTALDSTVNLFLLERDGLTPESSPYLERQRRRVEGTLDHLDGLAADGAFEGDGDAALRLACYLSWGRFRERITLDGRSALAKLLTRFDDDPVFAATHPSEAG